MEKALIFVTLIIFLVLPLSSAANDFAYNRLYDNVQFIEDSNASNDSVLSANIWNTTDLGPLSAVSQIGTGDITDDNTYVRVDGDNMSGNLTTPSVNVSNIFPRDSDSKIHLNPVLDSFLISSDTLLSLGLSTGINARSIQITTDTIAVMIGITGYIFSGSELLMGARLNMNNRDIVAVQDLFFQDGAGIIGTAAHNFPVSQLTSKSSTELITGDRTFSGDFRIEDPASAARGMDLSIGGAFGLGIFDMTANTGSIPAFDFRPKSTQFGLFIRSKDNLGVFSNWFVTDAAVDYMSFNMNGATDTDALNVDANDNVGVGCISSGGKLEVCNGEIILLDDEKFLQGLSSDISIDFNSTDRVVNAEVGSPNAFWTGFTKYIFDSAMDIFGDVLIDGDLNVTGEIIGTQTEKTWVYTSPSGSSGIFYFDGFYDFASSDNDFNPATTHGSANNAYAAHFFVVCAAGASGGTDTVINISGTSINDGGTRVAGDSETITMDDVGASGAYGETPKKWLGQVSIVKLSGPDLLCNYGYAKYWDNNNFNFSVVGLETTWLGGANDAGADIKLIHHKATGWTYNAGSTPTPPTAIASMALDHGTENDVVNGENGAWKRDNLDTFVEGEDGEGTIIEITTTANKAFELGNFLLRIKNGG